MEEHAGAHDQGPHAPGAVRFQDPRLRLALHPHVRGLVAPLGRRRLVHGAPAVRPLLDRPGVSDQDEGPDAGALRLLEKGRRSVHVHAPLPIAREAAEAGARRRVNDHVAAVGDAAKGRGPPEVAGSHLPVGPGGRRAERPSVRQETHRDLERGERGRKKPAQRACGAREKDALGNVGGSHGADAP